MYFKLEAFVNTKNTKSWYFRTCSHLSILFTKANNSPFMMGNASQNSCMFGPSILINVPFLRKYTSNIQSRPICSKNERVFWIKIWISLNFPCCELCFQLLKISFPHLTTQTFQPSSSSSFGWSKAFTGWPKCTDCKDFIFLSLKIVWIVRIFSLEIHLFLFFLTNFSKFCIKIFEKKLCQKEVSLTYFLH